MDQSRIRQIYLNKAVAEGYGAGAVIGGRRRGRGGMVIGGRKHCISESRHPSGRIRCNKYAGGAYVKGTICLSPEQQREVYFKYGPDFVFPGKRRVAKVAKIAEPKAPRKPRKPKLQYIPPKPVYYPSQSPEEIISKLLPIGELGSGRRRGGLTIGGRRRYGGDSANAAAAKRSPWIHFVKQWAHAHKMGYAEALRDHGHQISAAYRR